VPAQNSFVITAVPAAQRPAPATEICEHKGIGHPDSICDGVAEAISGALSRAYLQAYGAVQHYNVDKALLIAGESLPRLGGGKVVTPIRLIVAGRASPLPGGSLAEVIRVAARDYLATALRCDPDWFAIEWMGHSGSTGLRQLFADSSTIRRANDTSFGAAYAPYSTLDRAVLRLGEVLRSREFHDRFPAAGIDYKIMGARVRERMSFTIAIAFIDRHVDAVASYFALKAAITRHLLEAIQPIAGSDTSLALNTLDDPAARDAGGIYLTVTGLSAEQGDDGEVGRGNRLNGLITPGRPMSLEAAAGKNGIAHVGKIYNALALEMARAICAEVAGVMQASVQILSAIGRPVSQPRLVAIEVINDQSFAVNGRQHIEQVASTCLARIDELSARLTRGEIAVF
jgi:S-adenosylmethionine synthetase